MIADWNMSYLRQAQGSAFLEVSSDIVPFDKLRAHFSWKSALPHGSLQQFRGLPFSVSEYIP
ncbi:MAG: hypothetical protein H0V61_07550 [Chitinophagales bacterium]|nr:hypothetical protein [Chitinophagales bacterium]